MPLTLKGSPLLLALLCLAAARAEELEEFSSLLQVQISLDAKAAGSSSRPGGHTIHHLRIPETAGAAFAQDAPSVFGAHSLDFVSREGCFAFEKGSSSILGTALLLRKPRGHVLSMFETCNSPDTRPYVDAVTPPGEPGFPRSVEVWLRQWKALKDSGWHGDFTPPASPLPTNPVVLKKRAERYPAWSMPPFHLAGHPLPDIHRWPSAAGGGSRWHFEKVPGHCYAPLSLQAQRLSCQTPLNYTTPPDADLAVRNMQGAFFVGLVEEYQASICLLRVKLGDALPEYCDCKVPKLWSSFGGSARSVTRDMDQKVHGLSNLSSEVLRLADELSTADRKLYDAARARFVAEIRQVEEAYGTTIVCNKTALLL